MLKDAALVLLIVLGARAIWTVLEILWERGKDRRAATKSAYAAGRLELLRPDHDKPRLRFNGPMARSIKEPRS